MFSPAQSQQPQVSIPQLAAKAGLLLVQSWGSCDPAGLAHAEDAFTLGGGAAVSLPALKAVSRARKVCRVSLKLLGCLWTNRPGSVQKCKLAEDMAVIQI